MKRKKWLAPLVTLILIAGAALCLWQLGCRALDAFVHAPTERSSPSHLVVQVDVGVYPLDAEDTRTYTSQLDLDTLLKLLRQLPTEDAAPDAPDPGRADGFYAVTMTYADGCTAVCYLIEDQYFRDEAGNTSLVQPVSAAQFREFLKSHPGITPTP